MTANHCTPALSAAAEAAYILRVKQSWLERQAAARKIPFTMLGGAYKFTRQQTPCRGRRTPRSTLSGRTPTGLPSAWSSAPGRR